MKKFSKNKLQAVIVFCIVLIVVMLLLWLCDIFKSDYSAEIKGESLLWNGKTYSPVGGEYTEGKTIAKSKDGWDINEVKEDPTHNFVVVRSFLDNYLYVSDDYSIPTNGKLTTVCWNDIYINDILFLEALSKIENEKTTSFTYETEGIFQLTENQHMRSLYFSYENCPVATNFKGYMGKVNGQWVITTYIPQHSSQPYSVSCYVIPDEYESILEKYFS